MSQISALARLGEIVRLKGSGEYARPRYTFHYPHPDAGKVEIGMTDGTTRLVTLDAYEPATGYPLEIRAIPVAPDASDGSSRPMGVCTNADCGVTANVISARPHGARKSAPYRLVCTHCYRRPSS